MPLCVGWHFLVAIFGRVRFSFSSLVTPAPQVTAPPLPHVLLLLLLLLCVMFSC
jgi:hypothetical protein